MKKSILNVKVQLIVLLTFFSGTMFAQPSLPAICNYNIANIPKFDFEQSTNAVRNTPSVLTIQYPDRDIPGLIHIESIYVYTVVIPFDDYQLTGGKITTKMTYNFPNTNCPHPPFGMCSLEINGTFQPLQTVNPSSSPYTNLTSSFAATNNLLVGTHNFIVKTRAITGTQCATQPTHPCSTTKIRVIVQQELPPLFNLTINSRCEIDSHYPNPVHYSGRLDIGMQGTTSNLTNLFIAELYNPSGTLINFSDQMSINMATSYYLFSPQQQNGLYTIKVKRIKKNIFYPAYPATSIYLTNGQYGWNNLSINKTFNTCLNFAEPQEQLSELKKYSFPGVNEPKNNLKLYPNPIENTLNVNLDETDNLISIRIFDQNQIALIKKVFENKSNKAEIDVANLKKGFYFIEIESDKEIIIEKIIKQ